MQLSHPSGVSSRNLFDAAPVASLAPPDVAAVPAPAGTALRRPSAPGLAPSWLCAAPPGSSPAAADVAVLPTSMSLALRAPLHDMLGCAQLLCLEADLTPPQVQLVNSAMRAGRRLLERLDSSMRASAQGSVPCWREPLADLGEEELPAPPTRADDAAAGPVHGRLHVLVVDDSPVSRDIAAAFLRAVGHTVTVLQDGGEAISAVARTDFDVVLMDLCMPGLDGLDATRRIRALPGPRGRVPILALTALAFAEDAEACRSAGMNGHLAKPFRYDTLRDCVTRAVMGGSGWNGAAQDSAPGMGTGIAPGMGTAMAPGKASGIGRAPDAAGPDGRAGVAPAWLDIANPWAGIQQLQPAPALHAVPPASAEGPFRLTLPRQQEAERRPGGQAAHPCEPPPGLRHHEFHWLVFVRATPGETRRYSATCDLWRWTQRHWRSVAVPGAQFSPAEMHDQGWRYCGPCADRTAMIDITTVLPG